MQIDNFHVNIDGMSVFLKKVFPDNLVSDLHLILLHDALGSVDQWRDFPQRLATSTKCSVIVYDRPLHGKSAATAYHSVKEQFDVEKELLHRLLTELEIDQAGLVGVSDGATISLNFACSYPCSFVVAMAPHVVMEGKIIEGIRAWMQQREEYEAKLEKFHGSYTMPLINQWYRLWQKADKEGWDMTERLVHITCPVVLVQDPDDPYGSLLQIERIEECLPQAVVHLLEGAGHFPYISFESRITELIKSFNKHEG